MGTLYLVATPVGNLEDITLRALRILKEVDLVACEDTRHTAKLLTRYEIGTPRESYHKYNEESRAPRFVQMLREGKNIALVSDSGTPLVSDPGYELVALCRKEGIPVVPIPGPSAAVAALIGSGLPCDSFYFAGFLPPRESLRKRKLQELASINTTLVLYEAPHRLLDSLEDMLDVLGPRRITVARELTKIHEEFLQGSIAEILEVLRIRPAIQGEITLVIERGEPSVPAATWPGSIKQHVDEIMNATGLSRNEALKSAAKLRGIGRREAYQELSKELRDAEDQE